MACSISIPMRFRCPEEKDPSGTCISRRKVPDSGSIKLESKIDHTRVLSAVVEEQFRESGLPLSETIPAPLPILCNHKIAKFVSLLLTCAKKKNLREGIRLHEAISQRGLVHQCSDALVSMYAKCGALAEARELLDMYSSRDASCWTSVISGYVRQGHSKDALDLFDQMQHEGLPPDAIAFTCILKACGGLKMFNKGKQIHGELARQGLLQNDIVLGTALIDMYAKCGALVDARRVLEELNLRDVICWNSLITGYVQWGQAEQAIDCFDQLQYEGLDPDAMTFACILKACGTLGALEKGEKIHGEIVKQDLLTDDNVLGNALVYMYAKCGALPQAQQVLEKMPSHDVLTWSALISGYAERGQAEQALKCYDRMQDEGISPDAMVFVCIMKVCGIIGAIDKGEKIHDKIASQGLLRSNTALGTALVDMYAKCGALSKAQQVFDKLPFHNASSWNSLITAYIQQGQSENALICYEKMEQEGFSPDTVTFTCILRVCATLGALEKGEQVHEKIKRQGLLEDNPVLCTALMNMYAKCGALAKAHRLLEELPSRDIVSWNALIGGYMEKGHGDEALICFDRMQKEGFSPDAVTFTSALKACGIVRALDKGTQIHDQVTRQGMVGDDIVLSTALVDMYVKCGDLVKAAGVLKGLPSRDVVAWNSLIAGYAHEGQAEQALHSLEEMCHEGLFPDAMTFSCILKACGAIAVTDKREQIHEEILRRGLLEKNDFLGTALVDMYVKGGDLAKAHQALEDLPSQSTGAWNALISGYTRQGQGDQALLCFERMQHAGLSPDGVTLSCVLAACSHLGLVEDGLMYFMNIQKRYCVKPTIEHYSCVIDLLGRAGHLEKAVKVVEGMPSSDDFAVWHTLMGACGKWGNVTIGRWAFDKAMEIDKSDGVTYVLMANIYGAAGMQEDLEMIKAMSLKNKAC